jgi:hypothetical protein
VRARLRATVCGLGLAATAVLVAGCADQEQPVPQPAPAAPSSTTASAKATTSGRGTPSATTSTALPGMPVPVSVGSSPVDATRLRSTDDLATVFGCPAGVPAIRLTATPAPPPPTGAPAPSAPDAVVCASALADNEALFLWYTPTPEAKLGALTSALDRARYVHGGPNWVAAGTINPQMGRVGGEVYR